MQVSLLLTPSFYAIAVVWQSNLDLSSSPPKKKGRVKGEIWMLCRLFGFFDWILTLFCSTPPSPFLLQRACVRAFLGSGQILFFPFTPHFKITLVVVVKKRKREKRFFKEKWREVVKIAVKSPEWGAVCILIRQKKTFSKLFSSSFLEG